MKGLILAGGLGTRLYPVTQIVCKQLQTVYDKPMISYPLSTLMLAGIREILIISTPSDTKKFRDFYGSGGQFGISLDYKVQDEPRGLADAFLVGKDFIGSNPACLCLGDNLLNGHGLPIKLERAVDNAEQGQATIFAKKVDNPSAFGIVELDQGYPVSIVEKPQNPKSDLAAIGLYFFPKGVSSVAADVQPSTRGEIEITSVIDHYLKKSELHVEQLGRGYTWFDCGSFDAMLEAANYVGITQRNTGLQIGCPEEIAFNQNWIDLKTLSQQGERYEKSSYGQYLLRIAEEAEKL